MPWRYYDIAEWTLKAKRVALKIYRRDTTGHHCFRLQNGAVYEGYIHDIGHDVDKEMLTFEWATGVWDDPDVINQDIVTLCIADIAALVA